MELFYIFAAITLVCVIAFLVVRIKKGGIIAMLLKTLASVMFIATGLIGASKYGMGTETIFIMLGLLFGLIGDILLDLKYCHAEDEYTYTNAGMLSFGLGHIMYFVATVLILRLYTDLSWLFVLASAGGAALITVLIMMVSKKMLDFGRYFYQSVAYTFVLSFMVCLTIITTIYYPEFWRMMAGIVLIFLSDLVLSFIYFGGKENSGLFISVNHIVYYAGQLMIAMFLFV